MIYLIMQMNIKLKLKITIRLNTIIKMVQNRKCNRYMIMNLRISMMTKIMKTGHMNIIN